jgi:hypothetical protein
VESRVIAEEEAIAAAEEGFKEGISFEFVVKMRETSEKTRGSCSSVEKR